MLNNLFFQISGIIFILFLLKIYFSKERFASVANDIYKKLVVTNLISLILNIFSNWVVINHGNNSLISTISIKLYLASIIIWLFILTTYVYVVSFKKTEKFSRAKTSSLIKLLTIIIPVCLVWVIAVSYLPTKLVNENSMIYYDGPGVQLLYIIAFVCVIAWFFRYISRINYIKRNMSSLILFIFMVMSIGLIIQIVYPELSVLTFAMYFITFTMYFGIDNPDLVLIKKLEVANKKIEETEVSKKDSLMKVSHAIRSPLNAIEGFSQSILEGSSENITEDVKHIKKSSKDILNIVNNILDVSDVDMEMYKLIYDNYNTEVLMKQIVALAKSKMKSNKVVFNIMVDDNMPAFLYGDSIRIKEIVLNVIYNAIKYTKVGNIELNIGCITIGNVCRLIITVKDTGIGITVDKMDHLFETKPSNNKELVSGVSELNLSTIREIIKSMNGDIKVESEYRDGTSVTLVIDQKIGINPDNMENADVEEDQIDKVDFTGKRVLIVDDDKINLKVGSRLLKSYNVTTDEVFSGYTCIEKIKSGEKYDLILLDDWMPSMSGVQTLKQLDKIEGFNTPVIALTANASTGMKEKYLRDGFNDFIPKPVERKELDRVMKKFLSE